MRNKLKEVLSETRSQTDIPFSDNPEKYWGTYDLGCSAALISVGYDLVSLDKENLRKVRFIFRQIYGIDKAVNEYFSNTLQVSARTLFDNIRMLKNRIYSS